MSANNLESTFFRSFVRINCIRILFLGVQQVVKIIASDYFKVVFAFAVFGGNYYNWEVKEHVLVRKEKILDDCNAQECTKSVFQWPSDKISRSVKV